MAVRRAVWSIACVFHVLQTSQAQVEVCTEANNEAVSEERAIETPIKHFFLGGHRDLALECIATKRLKLRLEYCRVL